MEKKEKNWLDWTVVQKSMLNPSFRKEWTFSSYEKACQFFFEWADYLKLDNIMEGDNGSLECGGRGYDYRLELYKATP